MILNLKNRFAPVAGSRSNLMTKLIGPHLILDVAAYRDLVGDITQTQACGRVLKSRLNKSWNAI